MKLKKRHWKNINIKKHWKKKEIKEMPQPPSH